MSPSETEFTNEDTVCRLQTALNGGHIDALLFDLDGVLTPTSDLHRRAWRTLFEPVFARHGVTPYCEDDYFEHIDGRPRTDGVRAMLASRGICLPLGNSGDPQTLESQYSLSEQKNVVFNETLREQGICAYPGTVAYLDSLAALPKVKLAVVTSSKNAEQILKMADLTRYFSAVVDGNVAAHEHIEGKPAPDTYVYAAKLLGTVPARAVVFEDAISGVQAGSRGHFVYTVGVNRGAGSQELHDAGANIVVEDLSELVVVGCN